MMITDWLLNHFRENPEAALTTADFISRSRGIEPSAITKSQRVSALRSMNYAVVRSGFSLALREGEGSRGQTIIYNRHNVRSYALARFKDWATSGAYKPGFIPTDEPGLLAMLQDPRYIELISPGGVWHFYVERMIAQDSGDQKRVVEINAALQAKDDAETARYEATMARIRSGNEP